MYYSSPNIHSWFRPLGCVSVKDVVAFTQCLIAVEICLLT